MKVRLAETLGFCYGVKRAVQLAFAAATAGEKGATLGPLIHNPQLIAELAEQGIGCKEKTADFESGETIIVRSHGVGPEVYKEIEARGLKLIDATCPSVALAQKKAAAAVAEGYFPIIIGEKNHQEVKSLLSHAGNEAVCVEENKDICDIPARPRYAVVIQTTFEEAKFRQLLAEIKAARGGEYKVESTICPATAQRQQAARELAAQADAMVVIGGRDSANTRHLYEIVERICPRSYHIETAAELRPEWFINCETVGITAGASTPDRLIKEAKAVMENEDFGKMLEEQGEVEVYPGKTIEGEVIHKDNDGVYVGFGYRHDGKIAYSEWAVGVPADQIKESIEVGQKVKAVVIPGKNDDNTVRLSKIRADKEAAWEQIEPLAEGEKRPAKVTVLRIVKNKAKNIVGLAVKVEGVDGFMPASHVELRRVEDFTPYIGQELDAEIIEVDPEKKRIVVSRRSLLKAEREAKHQAYLKQKEENRLRRQQEREEREERAYASVEEGQVLTGKVVKVAEFGLFVEVGDGLVGLVHNTELSWDRSVKAADVADVGAEVTVQVKKIDREARRVALSIKATQPDPWVEEAAQLRIGQVLDVEVVRFLAFGAIVRISERLEGLVHISEIAEERIAKPDDVLTLGQKVKATLLKKDLDGKKLGLSIVRAKRDQEKAEYRSYLNNNRGLTVDLSEQFKQD